MGSSRFAGQFTQKAKIGQFDQELIDGIVARVEAGEFTLEAIAERAAPSQYAILVSMWVEAMERGMSVSMTSLADDILYKATMNIKKYRKNAYSLSERQVRVIWNHVSSWLKIDAKTW